MEYTMCEIQKELGTILPQSKHHLALDIMDRSILTFPYLIQLQDIVDCFYDNKWSCCYQKCQTLLEITWEHLNTGHWKDVPLTWRYAYTYLSLFKSVCQYARSRREELNQMDHVVSAIKTCDMGLLMGAPVLDNILTKLVAKLQNIERIFMKENISKTEPTSCSSQVQSTKIEPVMKKKKESSSCEISLDKKVSIISCPSIEYFKTHHMDTQKPVILESCMHFWPAMSHNRWTIPYIKYIAGSRTVPIEVGSKYTEENWSQTLMTISDFIEKYIEQPNKTGSKGYLAQHQLFNQIPELQKDISVPSYCGLSQSDEDVDVNAWFGPSGTISPLHQDPKHNLLAQVVGQKYIRLYSTEHSDMVYPHDSRILSNTSQVDVENPDPQKFPNFLTAPYLECVLEEGQMLYIPPKYWHYVRSLSMSFSVSFWWE